MGGLGLIKWSEAMNKKSAADKPYNADLPAGTLAVEHMAGCTRLQAVIAAGRTKYKAERKKDEDLRTAKFRKRLGHCNGNYFAQV
jgi:hypothetical protein